jgi:hypothetical protein
MNTFRLAAAAAFVVASLAGGAALLECGPQNNVPVPGGGHDASLLDSAGDGLAEAAGDAGVSDAASGTTCPHARYILWDPDAAGPCGPKSGNGGVWVPSILFSQEEANGGSLLPEAGTAALAALPSALRPYCAYTWSSATSAPEDPVALASGLGGKGLVGPDCEIVSPVDSFSEKGCDQLPGVDAQATCAALWSTALLAAEVIPLGAPSQSSVRIVAVDTTRSGQTPDPNASSPHGNAVAAIATGIACGDAAPCAIQSYFQLGLPHVENEHGGRGNFTNGGKLGTPAEVAVATWAAMQPFAGPTAKQTILNLSVGWTHQSCSGTGGAPGTAPCANESAALDAVKYAECEGALVFAAAGNASSLGETDAGPLYPAAWEGAQIGDCSVYSGQAVAGPSALHAVAGVDFANAVLANARPGGRPKLAAYGNGVAVPYGQGAGYSPILTGSSIATAVASGVAAGWWSLQPTSSKTGETVGQALYEAGAPLNATADFPPSQQPVHRVSLCRLLGGTACGNVLLPAIAPVAAQGSVSTTRCTGAACPAFDPLADPIDRPWAYPQPGGQECGACMLLVQPDQIVLNAALNAPPTSPALIVLTDADGGSTSYVLQLDGGAANTFQVSFDAGAPARATLSVGLDGGGSTLDPIFIIPPPGSVSP